MKMHPGVGGRPRRAVATAGGSILLLVLLVGLTAVPASATVFANATAITIPDSGAATPYPSPIAVSGLAGSITDVNVTLTGYTHTCPDDVEALLVGPGGKSVVLMADNGGCNAVAGVNLTFDDAAVASLPPSAQIVTGTYKPTAFDRSTPVLAAFFGANPNGTWNLYVFDDASGDTGTIAGGWSLDIATSAPHPRTASIYLKGSKVKGSVTVYDGYSVCANGVPVKVQYRQGGHWRTLGKTATSGTGTFSVGGVSAGTKYRAIAKEATVATGDVCLADTSNVESG